MFVLQLFPVKSIILFNVTTAFTSRMQNNAHIIPFSSTYFILFTFSLDASQSRLSYANRFTISTLLTLHHSCLKKKIAVQHHVPYKSQFLVGCISTQQITNLKVQQSNDNNTKPTIRRYMLLILSNRNIDQNGEIMPVRIRVSILALV